MLDKKAMREELLKTVEQYVEELLPRFDRDKARKIVKAIKEGKEVTPVSESATE